MDYKKFIEKLTFYVPIFSLVCYIIGFLIWHIFLLGLKFDEIEILQSKFIYTGFFFLLCYSIFILIILSGFKTKKTPIKNLSVLIFILLFIFNLILFPIIPRFLGGGRPISMSILPNKTNLSMEDLNKLGIPSGEGSDIQTANLCIAYENSRIIIVLLSDRVIQLNKTQFNGLGFLPGNSEIKKQEKSCGFLAYYWIISNYRSGLQ